MGRFTKIPLDAFEGLQLDAGCLMKTFNPASPNMTDEAFYNALICATTGGIKIECKPSFKDLAEDVDNVPNSMKEFMKLEKWDCSMATTALGTTPAAIRLELGCADIDGTDETKIVPRNELKQTDFADIWWVGDKANGGLVAVKLKNALSTEGFSLQTTKNGKGHTAFTLKGHMSINAQNEVPMEFYSIDPDNETGA